MQTTGEYSTMVNLPVTVMRNFTIKKGEFPNLVLLSFDDAEGVFMDDLSWNIAINTCMNKKPVSKQEMKMILANHPGISDDGSVLLKKDLDG